MDNQNKCEPYKKGDHVFINKITCSSKSHFSSDCEGIIDYSYASEYGRGSELSYGIFIKDKGTSAWYEHDELSLIERGRVDLLGEWEQSLEATHNKESDLDWIFDNGQRVLEMASGSSIEALAVSMGVKDSLWGSSGEGLDYYSNAMRVLLVAKPYLETRNKDGWLEMVGRSNENT